MANFELSEEAEKFRKETVEREWDFGRACLPGLLDVKRLLLEEYRTACLLKERKAAKEILHISNPVKNLEENYFDHHSVRVTLDECGRRADNTEEKE